jgi:hypothetical protein
VVENLKDIEGGHLEDIVEGHLEDIEGGHLEDIEGGHLEDIGKADVNIYILENNLKTFKSGNIYWKTT